MAVHFRAKKEGLEGLPRSELPDSGKLLREGYHFTIPIIVLVYMLIAGYTPMLAGFAAIVLTVVVAIPLSATKRFAGAIRDGDIATVWEMLWATGDAGVRAFDRGVRMTIIVAAACATAGIVVGVVTLTGLGLVFSSLVANLSGGVLIIALLLTMVASIVMGMGLPTTAAYVVVAALGAPALTNLGVPTLAAHLFIFYFAIISAITPPIMLAVFTASGIAESDPWRTGATALGLAIVGFIVPFLFIYSPEIILQGTIITILLSTVTAIIGVIGLSASTQGYLLTDASVIERGLLFIGALALLLSGVMTDGLGLLLLATVASRQYVAVNGSMPFTAKVSR
jgi:TRAP transporter 4TM/12TM fusion protein